MADTSPMTIPPWMMLSQPYRVARAANISQMNQWPVPRVPPMLKTLSIRMLVS